MQHVRVGLTGRGDICGCHITGLFTECRRQIHAEKFNRDDGRTVLVRRAECQYENILM